MIVCGILAASVWLALQSAGLGSASRLDAEGLSLLDRGQVSEAEARFRKALEIDPQDADALNNLGVILRRRGEVAKAVELLQGAANPASGNARGDQGLGGPQDDEVLERELQLAATRPRAAGGGR